MLRDWIFMKARSRVEIDDALTVWQLKDAITAALPRKEERRVAERRPFMDSEEHTVALSGSRWRLPTEICACPMYLVCTFHMRTTVQLLYPVVNPWALPHWREYQALFPAC